MSRKISEKSVKNRPCLRNYLKINIQLKKQQGVLEVSKCKALRLRAKEHTEVCD